MLIKTEAKNGPAYAIRKMDEYDRKSFTREFKYFEREHRNSRRWVAVPEEMVSDHINRINFRFFIKAEKGE